MPEELRLYTDGATGGDPTQGAIGYRLLDASDEVLLEHAQQIGAATSNEAEYRAVMVGLSACQKYTRARIHCYADSELMVKQLRGEYPVSDPRLKQLAERVKRLAEQFRKVSFSHVRSTDPEMARTAQLASGALNAAGS
ncbi:MAG: ribonuclease HI family protein [Gemmatimonadales bacterium]|jgi:ribonuclease HI